MCENNSNSSTPSLFFWQPQHPAQRIACHKSRQTANAVGPLINNLSLSHIRTGLSSNTGPKLFITLLWWIMANRTGTQAVLSKSWIHTRFLCESNWSEAHGARLTASSQNFLYGYMDHEGTSKHLTCCCYQHWFLGSEKYIAPEPISFNEK